MEGEKAQTNLEKERAAEEKEKAFQEKYKKYEENKELVKDDNPYSRLYALKKMGLIENYEDITKKAVVVVGVGGVGSVTCEMLVRMGIGKLIMFDYDKVEVANMNRLFYTPDQVGLTKVEAAKLTLEKINPRVVLEAYNGNVTSGEYYEIMESKIKSGGLTGGKVDIVLSCVDNYAARMAINRVCNEQNQMWIESGVSENAMSCHIQLIIPGETSCFSCIPPLALVENSESKVKREGVCAASLPTTMGITAGFLAHTTMKLLLEYEEVALHLQYNAKKEFFSNSVYPPNPECKDSFCLNRQKESADKKGFLQARKENLEARRKKEEEDKAPQVDAAEVEEWGIELVDEEKPEEKAQQSVIKAENNQENTDDLMKQLLDMQN